MPQQALTYQSNMPKRKVQLEYVLRSKSRSIIWNFIATPTGMSKWFADEVERRDSTMIFKWGKEEQREAKIKHYYEGDSLKMRWKDETDTGCYVEIRLDQNELTLDYILTIIDFAEEGEVNETKDLWDTQVDTLLRISGI